MAYSFNLTEDDIFKICKSSAPDAINIIKGKVESESQTVSDVLRNRILHDCILDQINYSLARGFTLRQCLLSALYSNNLIRYIKENPDVPCDQFLIYVYKTINNLSSAFNEMQLKQILDYLNECLFINYDLYKYVFTYEREAIEKNEEKRISCPPKENFLDNNLDTAKKFHIWEYENKLGEIEKKEKETNNMFLERRLKLDQQNDSIGLNTKVQLKYNENLSEEILSNLIDSISMPILNKTSNLIQNEAEEIKENILLHLEKVSITRPDELGPLPSITPKTYKTIEPTKASGENNRGSAREANKGKK